MTRASRLQNQCTAGAPYIDGEGKPWERWYYKPCLRITCATCEPLLCGGTLGTPSGEGLCPHKSFLGSKRVPYATWIKTATMYVWPLWRNWTAPKPVKVETGAQVRARHLATKPAGYSWRIERLTPAERRALA